MDAYRSPVELAELSSIGLTRRSVARLSNGRGKRVRVESGTAWLTQADCNDDVILRAGESFCIERDGATLISALNVPFALVTIEPASYPTSAGL